MSASRPSTLPAGDDDLQNCPPDLLPHWTSVRAVLRRDLGDVVYRTWLGHMRLVGIEGGELVVQFPTKFLRDYVRSNYGERLAELWRAELAGVRGLDLRVIATGPPDRPAKAATGPPDALLRQSAAG